MTKEHLQLTEAFGKFNSVLPARLRFFIGGAIKDALILGGRSDLLKDNEAQALLDIVEADIMADARKADEVRTFLAGSNTQTQREERTERDGVGDMTPREYYEIFSLRHHTRRILRTYRICFRKVHLYGRETCRRCTNRG